MVPVNNVRILIAKLSNPNSWNLFLHSIPTSSQVCPSPVRLGLDFGLGLGLGLANLDGNVNGPELDNLLTMFQKLCKPLIQSPD